MPTNTKASDADRKPVIVAGEGVSPVKHPEGMPMPTFGTMRPGVSFKNVVTQNSPATSASAPIKSRGEEATSNKSVTAAPGEGSPMSTTLKFGTLSASLPPRVQSAPPTLEEKQQQQQQQQQVASSNAANVSKGLEPTPEGEETQFKNASVPPALHQVQVENVRPFVPNPQPYYPVYHHQTHHVPQHQQGHHHQQQHQHQQQQHHYGGRKATHHVNPYYGNYGAPVGYYMPPHPPAHYAATAPMYASAAASALPVPRPDAPESAVAAGGAAASKGSPASTDAKAPVASVPVAPRPVSKKIQIVDPSTMKEVDLVSVAKVGSRPPSEASPVVKAEGAATASPVAAPAAAPAVPPAAVVAPPLRKPVVLVDPTSNKEVDLSSLASSTQKLAKILDEMDDDDLFDDEDGSISGSDKSDLDDMSEGDEDDEDEDEDEEDELANVEFPVILTRSIKVSYPEGAIPFAFPAAGEPLRYSTEFLLQFAPHCKGEAKDIASVAFPKEIPTERAERRTHRTSSGRTGGGSGRHGDRDRDRRHRHPSHYNAEDAVLTNRAADAWKRASAMVMDEDKVLLREVKLLLNKLTEEKFETITKQILEIGVLKTGMTTGVIDMLFDKAVEEPRYAPLYAQLCCRIWNFEIEALKKELPEEDQAMLAKKSVFRRSLVTKCQVEYDTKRAYSKQRLEKLMARQMGSPEAGAEGTTSAGSAASESPAAAETPAKLSGELTEEDYAMIKLKRRVLGNMRFIGELFIAGLIPAKIMHSVIQELLADITNPEEEEVESVCRLLPTVGAALDKPDTAFLWTKYVERMKVLSGCTKLPTRVRFMVQDVLELRDNGWRKVKPVAAASSVRSGAPPRGSDRRDRMERNDRGDRGDRTERGERAERGEHRDLGTTRPGRDAVRYNTARSQDVRFEKTLASPAPVPAAASTASADDEFRKTSVTRIQSRPPSRPEEIPRPASSASKTSQASQESLNRFLALETEEAAPTSVGASPLSCGGNLGDGVDEKLLGKLTSTLDEALLQKNFGDVTAIFASDFAPEVRPVALQFLLLHAMDKGRKHVEALTQTVLPSLIDKELVSSSVMVDGGLRGAWELLDDLVVDIPNALEFAGSVAAVFLDAHLLNLSSLVESILGSVVERSPAAVGKVVLHALHASRQDTAVKEAMISDSRDALDACLFAESVRSSSSLRGTVSKLGLQDLIKFD